MKAMSKIMRILAILSVFVALPAFGRTMKESIQQAVLSHPDVQGAWHAFRASEEEQEAARGGYRPRIDLSASVGWENLGGSGYDGRDQHNYFREGAYLTLSQMLYDGGLTRSQVKKFGYAKNAKYYDLRASMEKIALLAFRSHDDVNRYREMIRLAKQNLERHEEIMKLVQSRSRAGLESAANMEVVKGRVALARVNLITEEGNLHDASTQYLRTVGEMPDEEMEWGGIDLKRPDSPEEALRLGMLSSPRQNGVAQSVQSTRLALEEQKAKLSPRVELRGGLNLENDTDGTKGRKDKSMIELVIRYNLYNGGTDEATIRRFVELYKQSEEILKETEREVTQALLVAYNDIDTFHKQLEHLDQHQKSAEAMEAAYRKQFEVGRRSLLDLLDAQNESFQAKRAYINALFSYEGAKASYLHEVGGLVAAYQIVRKDVPSLEEVGIQKADTKAGKKSAAKK